MPGIPRRVPRRRRRGCGPGRRDGADTAGDEAAVRDRVPFAEEVLPAAAQEATGASAAGGAGCARRRRRREEREDGVAESARDCAVGLVKLQGHLAAGATAAAAAAAARHLERRASRRRERGGGERKAEAPTPESRGRTAEWGWAGSFLTKDWRDFEAARRFTRALAQTARPGLV